MRRLEETLLLLAGQDPAIDAEELIDRIELHLSEGSVPVVARDRSSLMQTIPRPPEKAPPRPLKKAWLLAAAVLAVVTAIGTPLWLLGGEGPGNAVSEPEAVFSWGEDIRKWVTAAELTAALESSTRNWEGAALNGGEVAFDDEENWTYKPIAPEQRRPWVEPVSPEQRRWMAWSGSFHEFDWEAAGFPDSNRIDPRLPDGVVFWPAWGGEIEGFRGPNSNEAVAIHLDDPYNLYSPPGSNLSSEDMDNMYLEVVSMVLRELGWAD